MKGPNKNINFANMKDGERIFHSDGSWSERVGDRILHSDGSWSEILGDTLLHSDGSWSEMLGDMVWGSDGSWSETNGNTTWYSDGSSSYNQDNDDSQGGCYLTTACTIARNLPDDCEELSVLRKFRDGYLKKRINGEEDILHYYRVAPIIVKRIQQASNAEERFGILYEELIVPCVNYINAGQFEKAYKLYKATTLKLEREFNI